MLKRSAKATSPPRGFRRHISGATKLAVQSLKRRLVLLGVNGPNLVSAVQLLQLSFIEITRTHAAIGSPAPRAVA